MFQVKPFIKAVVFPIVLMVITKMLMGFAKLVIHHVPLVVEQAHRLVSAVLLIFSFMKIHALAHARLVTMIPMAFATLVIHHVPLAMERPPLV